MDLTSLQLCTGDHGYQVILVTNQSFITAILTARTGGLERLSERVELLRNLTHCHCEMLRCAAMQLGEHGAWEKYTTWEDGTRIPLIIRDPSTARNSGLRTRALVESVGLLRFGQTKRKLSLALVRRHKL